MSKKNGAKGQMVGNYVKDIRDCLIASAVSGQHVIICGPPGKGKTDIARIVADKIFPDAWVQVNCSPTMDQSPIVGNVDIGPLLESPPRTFYNLAGSASDPNARCVIPDEITRAPDPILENFIHLMANKTVKYEERPVFWGTANFIQKSNRLEAVFDRVGFVPWVPTARLDIKRLSKQWSLSNDQGLDVDGTYPTWKEIQTVRKMIPTENAIGAVSEFLSGFVEEVDHGLVDSHDNVKRLFEFNERRASFWHTILTRLSFYGHGTADFTEVHPIAKGAMKWAWVSKSPEEASDWIEMAYASGIDQTQFLIDSVLRETYKALQNTADNISNKAIAAKQLTEYIKNNFKPKLVELGIEADDQRIIEMQDRVTQAVFRYVSGQSESIYAAVEAEDESNEEATDEIPF